MTVVPMPPSGFSAAKTAVQILYQTGKVPVLEEDVSQWNVIKAGYSRQLILNRFSAEQMEQPAYRDMLLECLRRPEVRQASFWIRLEDDIIQDLSVLMKHPEPPVQEPAEQSEAPPVKFLPQIPKFLVSTVNIRGEP